MANSKISALTSATTPLAGTEVLPIVQSSTTKKVSVDDLTTGKRVTAKDFYSTNTSGTNNYYGYNSGGSIAERTYTNNAGFILSSYQSAFASLYTKTTDLVANADSGAAGELRILTTPTSGAPTEAGRFTYAQNYKPIATKGIDFSANTGAAGMTSQLLNWYEEGTFTPTLGGTTTYTAQIGYYTRVGRQVTVQIYLAVDQINAPTSASAIRGLPFTAANVTNLFQTGSVSYWSNANTPAYWIGCYVSPNTTVLTITSTTTGAQAAANTPFAIFKNGTEIFASLTYFV